MTRKPRKSRATTKRTAKARSAAKARGKVRSSPVARKNTGKKVIKAIRHARTAKPTAATKGDPLDTFVVAAANALALPIEPAWMPAIRTNLDITLRHAALVADFKLPDEAEPAPIFKA